MCIACDSEQLPRSSSDARPSSDLFLNIILFLLDLVLDGLGLLLANSSLLLRRTLAIDLDFALCLGLALASSLGRARGSTISNSSSGSSSDGLASLDLLDVIPMSLFQTIEEPLASDD